MLSLLHFKTLVVGALVVLSTVASFVSALPIADLPVSGEGIASVIRTINHPNTFHLVPKRGVFKKMKDAMGNRLCNGLCVAKPIEPFPKEPVQTSPRYKPKWARPWDRPRPVQDDEPWPPKRVIADGPINRPLRIGGDGPSPANSKASSPSPSRYRSSGKDKGKAPATSSSTSSSASASPSHFTPGASSSGR